MTLTSFKGWDFFLAKGSKPVGLVVIHEIFGHNPVAAEDAWEKTLRFLATVP